MRIDAGTILAGLVILGACAWGLAQILSAAPGEALTERPALQAGPVPDPAALRTIASRLQPPAAASMSAPEPVADAAPPALDIQLIGLVESDTGWVALLSLSGEAVTARPGDVVRGYLLSGVDARSVVLERGDERLRLELES